MGNKFLNGLIFLAVATVVFLQLARPSQKAEDAEPPSLEAIIPARLAGWQVKDKPLGATEAIEHAAQRRLNLDAFVYRSFTRGKINFEVYVAWWAPGRMPIQRVASHTPDRCWTENGWACTDMVFDKPLAYEGIALKNTEYREFEIEGSPQYVYYWHLLGDEVYDYGKRFNAVPDPWLWIKGALSSYFGGPKPQTFIRVNSNIPLEELREYAGFRQVMLRVADLGLKKEATTTDAEG